MFCIGINGLWYVSLSWEFGVDEEPWIHLEEDYGYQFDDSEQVALMRARVEEVGKDKYDKISNN